MSDLNCVQYKPVIIFLLRLMSIKCAVIKFYIMLSK